MPLARKIFFYIFALIYVIFCPLIVLYSLGYVFKPNIEQHVVETGTIYLATMPPGASVRLNDRPRPGTTPIALDELMPGNYRVEVSMEGYKPWTANLAVMAGAATVQRRILLVSKNWNPELLLTEKIEKLIPIPEAPFFLIAKGELLSDYAAYDWKKKTFTPLLKTDLTYAGYRVLRCFTERDSHFFICEIVSENRMGYLWFDVNGLDIIVRDISNKVYGKPYQIAWDPDDGDNIFIFYSDTVNRLETSSGKVYDNYLKGIRGWGMKNKDIYVLTDDAKFISMDYEKKNIRIVLDDPELFTSLFGASGRYSIMTEGAGITIFLGNNGELLTNHLPYRVSDRGVIAVEFDKETDRALVVRRDKIGILDFNEELAGAVPFEKGPKLVWVYSSGNNIRQAFWVYRGSHILFLDENRVYLLELEPAGASRLNRLFETKGSSSVLYIEKARTLYYLEPTKGYLASVEIVRGKEEIQLPFPGLENVEKAGEP